MQQAETDFPILPIFLEFKGISYKSGLNRLTSLEANLIMWQIQLNSHLKIE